MLYIVLIPAWLWALIIFAVGAVLLYLTRAPLRSKNRWSLILTTLLLLRCLLAVFTAVATTSYAIGKFPCLSGIFGVYSAPFFLVLDIVFVLMMGKQITLNQPLRIVLKRSLPILGAALSLNLLIVGAHLHSLLLCTV